MLDKVKDIVQLYDNAVDYIEEKRKQIKHVLDTADAIVVMGMSPVGHHCLQHIGDFVNTKNIYCMDNVGGDRRYRI